jgi:hypothetical protein
LNLDLELPGVIANSIDYLVHVVPYRLEGCVLRPEINDILPHCVPHIRNIGAAINPSGCGVWSYARVFKDKTIDTLRITEVKSTDAPNGFTRIPGTCIVSMHELVAALGK